MESAMAETPRFAHLIALLFLGSAFAIVCSLVAVLVAVIAGARTAAKFAAGGAALVAFGYTGLLLLVGLFSRSQTLPPGGWKYFCEADCHIAYAIDSVRQAATLGPEARPVVARGRFLVVRLKTWFDQNSIAPFRGNSPLTPDPRTVKLIDDAGRPYPPLSQVPAGADAGSVSLGTPLRPGESYATVLVFELPAEAKNPRLLISDSDPITRLLADHENSPLHGKIYLALAGTEDPARSRLSPATNQ
jgi:hypothetical protein